MNRNRLSGLLLCGLVSALTVFPATAAKKDKTIDPATLEQLREAMFKGECPTLLPKVVDLRKKLPEDPDLMTLEANCRMAAARRVSRAFDADLYERTKIGIGLATLPMSMTVNFEKVVMEFEPQGRDTALSLFAQALAKNPGRTDLIVGYIAALMDAGQAEQAAAVVRKPENKPSLDVLPTLTQVVKDQMQQGHIPQAATLCEALYQVFPDAPPVLAAQSAVLVARQETSRAVEVLKKYLAGVQDPLQIREGALTMILARQWQDTLNLLAPLASTNREMAIWMALVRGRLQPRSALPIWKEIEALLKQQPNPDPASKGLTEHYLKVLQGEKLPTPAMRLRAAQMFAKTNLPVPTLVEADTAAFDDPSFLEARRFIVSLFREMRRFDLALEELDRMVELSSRIDMRQTSVTPGEIQLVRGQVLYALNRDTEALDALEKAAALGSKKSFLTGLAALGAGQRERAIAAFKQAAEEAGEDSTAAQIKLQQLGASPQETTPANK